MSENRSEIVVWLHGDHLSVQNPALTRYPNAPVVFVFDEPFLQEAQFAFHRLFFLYESVLDLFETRGGICSVRRGNVVQEVASFAEEHGATVVATTQTPGERFASYRQELAQQFRVQALPVPLLVPYDAERVPKRFSAWWREVENEALTP
ncbi:MAG: hypothetical protein OHK0029_39770 [Armatimonadaceae bacterium]